VASTLAPKSTLALKPAVAGPTAGGWGRGAWRLREDTRPVELDLDFWKGRPVLVTGHTGFKGSWLSLWLQALGAHVTGVARQQPRGPSLYELATVGAHMHELTADVRDAHALRHALEVARPEVVLHLAAQPVVRRSLRDPSTTYDVNVLGTVNLLDAVRQAGSQVRAVVVVTSDKCYENTGHRSRPFVEDDPLGGSDPYSSSKACSELVVSAYRRSFFHEPHSPQLATARAGNVLGGGDWGEDRLVPDALRAVQARQPLKLRNPLAVRPWQHVLSPLSGYLRLAQELATGPHRHAARAWNFGPPAAEAQPVSWIVHRLAQLWDGQLQWQPDDAPNPPEASHLALDSSAAEQLLGWRPTSGLDEALRLVVEWHRSLEGGEDMREVSLGQIDRVG
jgi:CDP-glucose 4,6-dehydratase